MQIRVDIRNVQHIKEVGFAIETDRKGITCIVGKNGSGKTTLVKSMANFRSAATFKTTSPDGIFSEDSSISYQFGEEEFSFSYNKKIGSLDTKKAIPERYRRQVDAELPMPFGQRFGWFRQIFQADLDIRKSVVLEEYSIPRELIEFLREIYKTNKFDNLVEIKVKKSSYYCILLPDSRYIREDHLSSGEYFIINLYRKIKSRCPLIFIDEIDISLDAAAQVSLSSSLRKFCAEYEVNIVFTTHSLAMMKTLEEGELLLMDDSGGKLEIAPASYNYIKSILFGFSGWDRYILTEDRTLSNFIEYVISKYCQFPFYKYKIIYIGGGSNVTDLQNRNSRENFFGGEDCVISILDGDQQILRHARGKKNVMFIPWVNIEKKLQADYADSRFLPNVEAGECRDEKHFYKKFKNLLSEGNIFHYLCTEYAAEVKAFAGSIDTFLN